MWFLRGGGWVLVTARDLIGIWPSDRRDSTGGKSSLYGVINEPGADVVLDWNMASSSFALQVDSAYSSALSEWGK